MGARREPERRPVYEQQTVGHGPEADFRNTNLLVHTVNSDGTSSENQILAGCDQAQGCLGSWSANLPNTLDDSAARTDLRMGP